MKKKEAFETFDITEKCGVCEHAEILDQLGSCLCDCKGVVDENYHCRRFCYDITKRIPVRKRASECASFSLSDHKGSAESVLQPELPEGL